MARPFSDEQARTLVNLAQQYEVWMAADRKLAALPYDLRRKEIKGRDYLYEIHDRGGNGRSLGPWSEALAERFEAYRAEKADAKTRRDASAGKLAETCRLYRALRLPLIAAEAGSILREADRRGLLGKELMLVGTNAMPAYAIEAGGFIDAPLETQDLDFVWSAVEPPEHERLWPMLKAVDPTFAVNTERPFQARNAAAYEVEILPAPSRMETLAHKDRPRPVPMPEQEWLLKGRPVDHIVVARDGAPARIVAPDPRWFALQKLWLSEKPARNPLKRGKDAKQGRELLDAVYREMPHYPLAAAFKRALPQELAPVMTAWEATRPARPARDW